MFVNRQLWFRNNPHRQEHHCSSARRGFKVTRAFSLLELILVMAVLGAVAIMSFPDLQSFYQRHQLKLMASQLISMVNHARMQAIHLDQPMSVCGGVGCDGDWDQSQLLIDEADHVLQIRTLVPNRFKLQWRASFARNHRLSFDAFGFALSQGSFYLTAPDGQTLRLIVNRLGRIRQ